MKSICTLLLAMVSLHSYAQEISGKISDTKKNPIPSALVNIIQNGRTRANVASGLNGLYVVKGLEPGVYNLIITYPGCDTVVVNGIKVIAGKTITRNITLIKHVAKFKKNDRIVKEENELIWSESLSQKSTGKAAGASVALSDKAFYAPAPPVETRQRVTFYDPSLPEYKKNPENDFMNVKVNPLSTMSVDVDRASYCNVRQFINAGQKPPADAVRIEEMVNYFDYDYPQPKGEDPIAIQTELTNCPWQEGHKILHIGMQAVKVKTDNLPPSNLVFLIDVSGSMESPERLPLLVAGMKLLVNNLRPVDKVTIVTYAGQAGLALPTTSGNNKQSIIAALDKLIAGGSTAGGEGIELAYKMAQQNFIKGGNNRVLLATDGDFNVGVSSDNELEDLITRERESGIFLTCLGFGTNNYKDAKMEMLADKGNGNYDYIDNIQEAQKTLVSEFGGTLFVVAKDVKAQIEFNPARVQGYRLIGYEDRLLNNEDFKDDKKDAGDMGSGHTVTIMYEIIPTGVKSDLLREADDLKYQQPWHVEAATSDELATIKFRYKKPDGKKSTEMVHTIADKTMDIKNASENTRFSASVAMFGMLLKNSKYKGASSYNEVIAMAEKSRNYDKDGYRSEFVRLVKAAKEYGTKTTAR